MVEPEYSIITRDDNGQLLVNGVPEVITPRGPNRAERRSEAKRASKAESERKKVLRKKTEDFIKKEGITEKPTADQMQELIKYVYGKKL